MSGDPEDGFGGISLESRHPLLPRGLPPGEVPGADYTEAQQSLIAEEDYFRALFAANRDSPEISDPYVSLLDVFANRETFQYEREDPAEARIPKLLSQWRQTELTGYSIVTEPEFRDNWSKFTGDMFKGMDWSNVFCAGGSVLGCVVPSQGDSFRGSDIDLWIYGIKDDDTANDRVKHVHATIARNIASRGQVVRTNRAITILGEYPSRHVQIILRLYKSPLEVLLGFDIDSCTIGYDGQRVWAAKRFRRALNKRYNLVNPTRRSLTYEPRLFKYAMRGFAVAVPGLRKADVDRAIFARDPKKAQGLLKLLLFEHQALYPELAAARQRRRLPRPRGPPPPGVSAEQLEAYALGAEENPTDYLPDDVYIPWGPEWYADQILTLLNFTDRAQFFQRPNKNPKAGTGYRHRHIFVTGIEGGIEGSGFWCRLCKKERRVTEDNSGRFVQKKLTWLKDCPAYQDIEKGFRRQLMSGSFQPIIEANWEKDVYLANNRSTAESFFTQTPLAVALFNQSSSAAVERTVAARTASEYRCRGCAASFYSENQLLRHALHTAHPYELAALPSSSRPRSAAPLPALDKAPVELHGVPTRPASEFALPRPAVVKKHRGRAPQGDDDDGDASGADDGAGGLAVPVQQLRSRKAEAAAASAKGPGPAGVGGSGAPAGGPPPSSLPPAVVTRQRPPGRFSVEKTSRFLLTLARLARAGHFDGEQRGALKELLLREDAVVFGAFEVHEIDPDVAELLDTCKLYLARRPETREGWHSF